MTVTILPSHLRSSRRKRVLVLASGGAGPKEGGSTFQKIAEAAKEGKLEADVVVATNHKDGGVKNRAEKLGTECEYFPGPYTAEEYQGLVKRFSPHLVVCAGWLKKVLGLDPCSAVNDHPALLYPSPYPRLGGKGLYGHHVHELVYRLYQEGTITETGFSTHFVTPQWDCPDGVFHRRHVVILPEDTPDTIADRVVAAEWKWQWQGIQRVLTGEIYWDRRACRVPARPRGLAAEFDLNRSRKRHNTTGPDLENRGSLFASE